MLRPKYKAGCKRVFVTDNWYTSLLQPNVQVRVVLVVLPVLSFM